MNTENTSLGLETEDLTEDQCYQLLALLEKFMEEGAKGSVVAARMALSSHLWDVAEADVKSQK